MTSPGSATFVILARDQLRFTARCLETLAATVGEVDWVVVDNGSSDGTGAYLRAWQATDPGQRTALRNDTEVGAARARNQGWRQARGEWVVFLDNDVFLDRDPDWLRRLTGAAAAAGPYVVAASPLLLFPGKPAIVQCAGGGMTPAGHFGLLGRGEPATAAHAETRPQAWAPTAALGVRRAALEAAGGFDEAFDPVPICEDLDLCLRLRALGGTILFAGQARLRHSEGTTFGRLGHDKQGYWRRHARVIKTRWSSVWTREPLVEATAVEWRPVRKDYADFDAQRVLPGAGDDDGDLSFFASEPLLPAKPAPARIGVIGCGQAASRGALPGLAPPGSPAAAAAAPFLDFGGCESVILASVADADGWRACETAVRTGAPTWAEDGVGMLDSTPLEGVVIATPPAAQADLVVAALRRGVGVLVEKPGAADEEGLDRVLAALDADPAAICMVNLPWEFHAGLHRLAATLARGELGRVRAARALFEHPGPAAWAPEADWYFGAGAGLVRDLGLHAVAALERLLGGPLGDLDPLATSERRALAVTRPGGTEARIELGWDAAEPRFAIEIEGELAGRTIELIPARARQAVAGGPYRHFVALLRTGGTPLTAISARAAGLRSVLRWARAGEGVPA